MSDRLLTKLSHYGPIGADEAEALRQILTPPRRFERGAEVIRQFSHPRESTLMLEGISGRRVTLLGGEAQLTALHLPGDFVDLHGFVLNRLDHSVVALTDCVVTAAPHEPLRMVTERYPNLARALWFLTTVDAAIHRHWLTVIGRRDAAGRLAHLLCELWVRLDDVGLADAKGFGLALTQAQLADALCLSAVHLNRVVQELRARGLIRWRQGRVEILDRDALIGFAEFEAGYLQIDRAGQRA